MTTLSIFKKVWIMSNMTRNMILAVGFILLGLAGLCS